MADDTGKAPRDVVPPTSREEIIRRNEAVGTVRDVAQPAYVIPDVEGVPNGMGATATTPAFIGSLPVYRDELDAAGLTKDDVPNLRIIDRGEFQ